MARATKRRTASYWSRSAASRLAEPCREALETPRARARPVSGGPAGPGTTYSCSPATRSTARLVTMTWSTGHARSSSATSAGGLDHLLEVVEDERARARPRSADARASPGCSPGRGTTPSVCAIVGSTSAGSRRGSRATNQTPSGKSSATCGRELQRQARLARAARARERQQARAPRGAPRRPRSSRSRPTNEVSCDGQVVRAARRASGGSGSPSGSPSMTSWLSGWGRRSLRRCSPRSRSAVPGGQRGCGQDAGRLERRTCPPWAAAATRAARCTSAPT